MNKGIIIVAGVVVVFLLIIGLMVSSALSGDDESTIQSNSDIPRMETDSNFNLEDLFTGDETPEETEQQEEYTNTYISSVTDSVDIMSGHEKYTSNQHIVIDSLIRVIADLNFKLDSVIATQNEGASNITYHQPKRKNRQPNTQPSKKTVTKKKENNVYGGFSLGPSPKKTTPSTPNQQSVNPDDNSFHAIVHKDQSRMDGQTIELRVTKPFRIDGHTIPTGYSIYGIVKLTRNRNFIYVKSIYHNGKRINCHYEAYDGYKYQKGLEAEYNTKQDLAREGTDEGANQTSGNLNTPLGDVTINMAKKKVQERSQMFYGNHKIIFEKEQR